MFKFLVLLISFFISLLNMEFVNESPLPKNNEKTVVNESLNVEQLTLEQINEKINDVNAAIERINVGLELDKKHNQNKANTDELLQLKQQLESELKQLLQEKERLETP